MVYAQGSHLKGHKWSSLHEDGKIPRKMRTRDSRFLEESEKIFQSTSNSKNKSKTFDANDPLGHDRSDLPVIVNRSEPVKGELKSSETTAGAVSVAKENFKRQYIYGRVPRFPSRVLLPRRDFVTYPASGLRRGNLLCILLQQYKTGFCMN